MFEIHGNNIYHIRGDTGTLMFEPIWCGEEAPDAYTATLSVKRNLDDEAYVLQKHSDNGVFEFVPADTKDLDPGIYVYDIEVQAADQVSTIGPYKYVLLADVTR